MLRVFGWHASWAGGVLNRARCRLTRSLISLRLLLVAILLPAVAAPAHSQPVAPIISGSVGPALAAGDGSKDMKRGLAFQLEATARRSGRNSWLIQASYEHFARDGIEHAIRM